MSERSVRPSGYVAMPRSPKTASTIPPAGTTIDVVYLPGPSSRPIASIVSPTPTSRMNIPPALNGASVPASSEITPTVQ